MLCSPGIDTTLLGFGNMNVLKLNLEVGGFPMMKMTRTRNILTKPKHYFGNMNVLKLNLEVGRFSMIRTLKKTNLLKLN